jgi:hypothetical protein
MECHLVRWTDAHSNMASMLVDQTLGIREILGHDQRGL